MKRAGLILILIICMGILPIQAQTGNFIEVDSVSRTLYYKDSAGYDKLLKPDGSVLIYSQRYTVEYLSGKTWKQVTTPYSVTQKDNVVTRHYSDYLGTTVQVIYRTLEDGSTKTDIVINSGADRVYRVVWSLDGITNNAVQYGDNWIQFNNGEEWVRADWNDAYAQFGDISVPTVSDSASGKKLDVIFNVGLIKAGDSLTLDPTLVTSYITGSVYIRGLNDNHPSDSLSKSAISQSFTISGTTNRTLDSIKLELWKSNNPTGNAYARIYTHTGSYGSTSKPGVLLASSDAIDVTTLPAAAGTYVPLTFTGANKITLVPSTYYVLTFEAPAAGTIDGVNSTLYYTRSAGIAGNYAYYANGAWTVDNTKDLGFYVYVDSWLTNDALDSDSLFIKDESGWCNVTVTDSELVANLATVDIQVNTTGDAETFTLRWTQATGVFSEVSDTSNICTLMAESTRVNIDVDTDKIAFNFNMTGGTEGLCDVRVTTVNDDALTDIDLYPIEFVFTVFSWDDEIYDRVNSLFADFGIVDYMTLITDYIDGVSTYFVDSLTNIVALLVQQFRIISAVYGWFIYWGTAMIGIVLQFSTYYHEFIDGTSAWSDALVPWWEFITGFLPAFPLFGFLMWLDSLSTRGRQTVGGALQVIINDVNTAIGLVSYFFGVFSFVANTIIDRILGLLGFLP